MAVFNFRMRSETPKWTWAEKGFADQITTDFTRSRQLAVIARDEMQLLASKLRWVPEMAADRAVTDEIRKAMKIDFLVSGFYTVTGDEIEVVAQVVNVETRKEVARKTLAGKTGQVLDLQKRLSAELLGWFLGEPAEKILPQLPVWSRSIDATRGLYEGIDLYDQGRYEEAWLKFRQARRSDPAFLEAHYWVGRMYYFLDRYEHARRAFEEFVYRAPPHPRMGDAIKEYVHTWEKSGAPPETLLKLYEGLIRRHPWAAVFNEMGIDYPITCRVWLRTRSGQLLGWMGRHEEATAQASAALAELHRTLGFYWRFEGWAHVVAIRNAYLHNQLTGRVSAPPGLQESFAMYQDLHVLRFDKQGQALLRLRGPMGPALRQRPDGRLYVSENFWPNLLLAPDGYSFRKVMLYPVIEGPGGKADCRLAMYDRSDVGELPAVATAKACEEGFAFDDVPRTGLLRAVIRYIPASADPKSRFQVVALRGKAELDKLQRPGSLRVTCPNATGFVVRVDGRYGRRGPGVIGPLDEGTYGLQFSPDRGGTCYGEHRTQVAVRAGRTTAVEVSLPWAADSPWASWSPGVLVGRHHLRASASLQPSLDAPCLLAERDGVRIIWAHMGDLWSAASTDGRTFSRPAKLEMPISSGWMEGEPRCIRDESGRYILAFRSDREARHQERVYVCWSRDFEHFSRPVMPVDRTVGRFDIIQDQGGRYLWADRADRKVTVLVSTDAYRWRKLGEIAFDALAGEMRLAQRSDGRYELFVFVATDPRKVLGRAGQMRLWRYLSRDGAEWKRDRSIDSSGFMHGASPVSVMHVDGRTLVAWFGGHVDFTSRFHLNRERADGAWERSAAGAGVPSALGAMAYHHRWGYLVAWQVAPTRLFLVEPSGPYLIRGDSVEAFFAPARKPAAPPPKDARR